MSTTSHTTISIARQIGVKVLTVAAVSAAGFLTVPASAQAHPMLPLAPLCHQYQFPGDFSLNVGEAVVSFNATGFFVEGKAVETFPGKTNKGNVKGGMNGLNNVDFTINWDNNSFPEHYTGAVGDDGIVHGVAVIAANSSPNPAHWDSITPLACVIAPAPAPAPQPAPPAQTAGARLGVAVKGPTTQPAGQNGIYTVNLSNSGDTGAPVELYVSFGGQLQQTGQVTPSGGFNCDVINNAGGTTAVHCTVPQLQSKATANVVVQGRGSAPGAGHLTATINSSDPGAQFVQKSQGLNVSIT